MAPESELQIAPIPAFEDNYIWLLARDGRAAVVDPGDPEPVLRTLRQRNLTLADILVTHHHSDHVEGVQPLARSTGARVCGPRDEAIPGRDMALGGGDRIEVLGIGFEVIAVPGHTRGHIAYHAPVPGCLFCGDTLFAAGCGRLFEGTAEQMSASLATLATLPGGTRMYCAHEYTSANIRFALAVEPGNAALRRRQMDCLALRERGQPTLPSTIDEERATNPFLRAEVPAVRRAAEARAGRMLASAAETFAVLRRWKDEFR